MPILIFLSINSNICVSCALVSNVQFFSLVCFIFSCLFFMPGNFHWMSDIVNLTLFGARYIFFYFPIHILEFCSGTQLRYLETVWFFLTFLLRFFLGRMRVAFLLKLIISIYWGLILSLLKKICWSSNTQYLRMWHHWEIRSLQI